MLAGQIGKPHGTSGEVYVIRISDDPARFAPGSRLLHANGEHLTVAAARAHRDRFLVRFQGYDDRNSAERLRGALYVLEEDLRTLAEGEFWAHDLVGCEVVDEGGTSFGTVEEILENPAHDLLRIAGPRGSVLLPVVKEFVLEIDPAARRIRIDPPDGLFGS